MTIDERLELLKSLEENKAGKIEEPVNITEKPSNDVNVDNEFKSTNLHTKDIGSNVLNPDNQVNQLSENIESAESSKTSKGTRLGKILPAKIALTMIDKLLPSTIVLLLHYFNLKLEKKKLQLTKDEINEIAPAVQDCLNDIELNFDNPWIALGFILSITYGSKIIDAIPEIEKKQIIKPGEKPQVKNVLTTIESIVDENEVQYKESNVEKFEKIYNQMVDEVSKQRRRGIPEAMGHIAEMYPEKIKSLMNQFGITDMKYINYRHVPKKSKRKKQEENDNNEPEFNL